MALDVLITDITVPPVPTGSALGVFEKAGGNGDVEPSGKIDLQGQSPNVHLTFRLSDDLQQAGYRFGDPAFSAHYDDNSPSPFGEPKNLGGDTLCTVSNKNQHATFKYTLYLVNVETGYLLTIDPIIVNR